MCCCSSISPECVAKTVLRVSFGAALALVGVAHYMTMSGFAGMVSGNLGFLSPLGTVWAYVLPALQIIGGVLIVARYKMGIAALFSGVALGSIVVGSLLRPIFGGASLSDPMVMGAVNNTFIWILVYVMVVKCCFGSSDKNECCSSDTVKPEAHSCCS